MRILLLYQKVNVSIFFLMEMSKIFKNIILIVKFIIKRSLSANLDFNTNDLVKKLYLNINFDFDMQEIL